MNKANKLGIKIEFVDDIKSITEYSYFILVHLEKYIKTKFVYKENSPTIVKKRYIDSISESKVIGIYNINDEILKKKMKQNLIKYFKKK